ncbi:hypothetical protein [Timonella sp. A28]|uniref:hypothetical protein n=1 Tax=Timonella sp. A28 TaxID=3442640 RepID=UPI003EB72DB3
MRTYKSRILVACTSLFFTCGIVTGCAEPHADVNPYEAEFTQAMAAAETDFERSVLQDGKITQAEIDEAHDLYGQCLNENGLDFTRDNNGGMQIVTRETEPEDAEQAENFSNKYMKIIAECGRGTIDIISDLDARMRINPLKEDYATIVVECFIRTGLRDSNYTVEDFENEDDSTFVDEIDFDQETACLNSPKTTG